MKNIVVCMKQVLDPEMPLSLFQIDTEARRAIPPRATPPVLSPFDENALEAALRIKDSQEATVTVINLGKKLTKAVVTSALAAGADRLILLQDDIFDEFNTLLTSKALAAAIQKLGEIHLVLCGLQAADTNNGQVGSRIAGILNIPCITAARKVEFHDDVLRIEKNMSDGYEVIETASPALVTVTGEVGTLRKPGMAAFISAAKKPVTTWDAEELGIETGDADHKSIVRMNTPVYPENCEIIKGANPEEMAANLAIKLKETDVI
jgi:electron transfer flavoprotein beta subunit